MLWQRCEFCPTGKSPPIAVQPLAQKFSAFLSTQSISVFAVSRAHKRGVGHRHERWAWGALLTRSVGGGRRSRVVLPPRRWRQVLKKLRFLGAMVANKPGRQGEREVS